MRHLNVIAACLLLLPGPAFADQVDLLAKNPRFYPIRQNHNMAPLRSDRSALQSGALRSDRVAVNGGFMPLDRKRLSAPMIIHANAVRKNDEVKIAHVNPAPETGVGVTDRAVLELFGNNDATENPAFKQAIGGIGKSKQAWPIPGSAQQKVTSGYGHRRDPFNGRMAFHSGIDIAAPAGTSVLASADGVVTEVTQAGRFGKYVGLRHRDGTESLYGHLSAQHVRLGQHVRQGQKLGEVGSTGRSSGPHLHYTLKKNGKSVDPAPALNAPVVSTAAR